MTAEPPAISPALRPQAHGWRDRRPSEIDSTIGRILRERRDVLLLSIFCLALVMATRNVCRVSASMFERRLDCTIHSGLATISLRLMRGQPSETITSSNYLPLVLCIFITMKRVSGLVLVEKCSCMNACG